MTPVNPDKTRAVSRMNAALERMEKRRGKSSLLLMEVCGTHTVAIARSGLKSLLPPGVRLVSGPGCPVCVTPTGLIDRAIALALLPGIIMCTFGDMLRVPGTAGSLEGAGAKKAEVRVVYSPRDCLRIARDRPEKKVVFFAAGFETTQPGIAATVREAVENGIDNFMILPAMKRIPPALRELLEDSEVNIDGFILPGHVSAVLGVEPYGFIADRFSRAGVVAGFEGQAILSAVATLVEMIADGQAGIKNAYGGVVSEHGNQAAKRVIDEVFDTEDAMWRGMGVIGDSGLKLKPRFESLDASTIEVSLPESDERDSPCRCGEVLRGLIDPSECGLFGSSCTPESPVGPCMVSAEGACQAHYRYGGAS